MAGITLKGWTPEEDACLRRLWGEGRSTNEIGRTMRRSKCSVVGRAHRLELPARPSPIQKQPSAVPPETEALIRGMVARRCTCSAIAEHLGVSFTTAALMLRKLGLTVVRSNSSTPGGAAAVQRAKARAAAAPGPATPDALRAADAAAAPPCAMVAAAPVVPLPALRKPSAVVSGFGRRCCWPLWNDATPREDRRFCEAPRIRGAYCAEHGARAYAKHREGEDDAPLGAVAGGLAA